MALADPPDAVVCDIGLPRLNGLQVAAELGRLRPKPLLIAVTAYGGVYTEELARAAGFDHYLLKPADPFEIERPGPGARPRAGRRVTTGRRGVTDGGGAGA